MIRPQPQLRTTGQRAALPGRMARLRFGDLRPWPLSGCSNMASQAANVEGVRLYQQGNYQQASDRFQQAIAQDPASPEGYYNLAASLHKTGTLYNRPADLQQAEVLYNQCLERDPNHAEAHRGLAVLLNETGRQPEAFRLLNSWAAANPKSPEPKIELARLLEETGQTEQAKTQLVEALTVDPHNARALTALGRLRDQSGNYAQALSDYQRSLAVNRFQPEVAARVAQLQAAANPRRRPPTLPRPIRAPPAAGRRRCGTSRSRDGRHIAAASCRRSVAASRHRDARHHFDNRPAELGQIVRLAAADEVAIDDDRRVLPDRAGVHQVVLDARASR